MLYFLMATMTGIVEIGILLLYRIKKASTTPKGLLVSSIFLSLGLLAFNYSMTSIIAPGYTHYGNQVYVICKDKEIDFLFTNSKCSVTIRKVDKETVQSM